MTQAQDVREHQQMKEVWSLWQMLLKKIVLQHVNNFLEPWDRKFRKENAQEWTSIAHGWATHSQWQCSPAHCGCCNQKLGDYGWEVLPHAPYSPDTSPPDLDLFPKLKGLNAWTTFFFSGIAFYQRYPSYSSHEWKGCLVWNYNASQTLGLIHWVAGTLYWRIMNRQSQRNKGVRKKKSLVHYFWNGLCIWTFYGDEHNCT